MRARFLLLLALVFAPALALAAPNAVVSYSVGVCDPSYAQRCIKPNADGSVNVNNTPSGTQDVNLKQIAGTTTSTGAGVTGTGTQRVGVAQDPTTLAGSAPGTAGSPSANVLTVQGPTSGGTPIPENQTQVNGVAVSTGAGAVGTGSQRVALGQDPTTIAGSAPGTAGSPSTNVLTVQGASSGTPLTVAPAAAATGGATPSHAIVAANTTSVVVDASPGTLYSVQLFNNSATIAYAKFYDAAQGSTTCGSGTPKKVLMIPGNTLGAGVVINVGGQAGVAFATAITRCVTTGMADNDATAPAASTYLVEADYK